jgi:hypothetical protein
VWDDAETDNGWKDEDDINPKKSLAVTLGFLIKETADHVVIASTISYDKEREVNTNNSRIQIPKKMIVTKRAL